MLGPLFLSLAFSLSLAHARTLSLSLSLARSLARSLSRPLARSLARARSRSRARTRARSLSISYPLICLRARSLSLSLELLGTPGYTGFYIHTCAQRSGLLCMLVFFSRLLIYFLNAVFEYFFFNTMF